MNGLVTIALTGMVGVLVCILGLNRLLRFTRTQAAAIGGLISVAILVPYLIIHWPGGDKAALYFSCNLLVAYSYYLIGRKKATSGLVTKPGFHWGPIVILGFFVVLIIVDGAFIVMAENGLQFSTSSGKNINTRFPGEVPNAYQKKEAFYNEFARKMEAQAKRGWQLNFNFDTEPEKNQTTIFRIRILDKAGQPVNDASGTVYFKRIADSSINQHLELNAIGRGIYETTVRFPKSGRWDFDLNIIRAQETFETSNNTIEVR